jgi:hypothetical protein
MKTGLADKYFAPISSHHNLVALGWGTFNSLSRVCIHIISVVALVIALYFASMFDMDTVFYFLSLQEVILEPRNMAKPPVNLLSSILST